MDVGSPVLILLSILYFFKLTNQNEEEQFQISHTPPPGIGYMTYVKMVKCIRISVIDIGVKSPKAGIAHPSQKQMDVGSPVLILLSILYFFKLTNQNEEEQLKIPKG
jgi:hypothetical protein